MAFISRKLFFGVFFFSVSAMCVKSLQGMQEAYTDKNLKDYSNKSIKAVITEPLARLMRFYRKHPGEKDFNQILIENALVDELIHAIKYVKKQIGHMFVASIIHDYLSVYVTINDKKQKKMKNSDIAFACLFQEKTIFEELDIADIFERACFAGNVKLVWAMLSQKSVRINLFFRKQDVLGLLFCSIYNNDKIAFEECYSQLYANTQKCYWFLNGKRFKLNKTIYPYINSCVRTEERASMLRFMRNYKLFHK